MSEWDDLKRLLGKLEANSDDINLVFQYEDIIRNLLEDIVNARDIAITRAEKAEAELAAHVTQYNEEVDQFNDGFDAGQKGELDPFSDQPSYETDHDSWRNGYYAGSYDRLMRELAALKEQTRWIPISEHRPPEDVTRYSVTRVRGKTYWTWLPPQPTPPESE